MVASLLLPLLIGAVEVGDFDFDGRDDFAVRVDQSGPYGSETFAIYLQTAPNHFVHSSALSALTETTMGLFQVDTARKRLVTYAKSGCCWHVTEELEVVAGTPQVVHRVTEDAFSDEEHVIVTEETLVGVRWIEKKTVSPR